MSMVSYRSKTIFFIRYSQRPEKNLKKEGGGKTTGGVKTTWNLRIYHLKKSWCFWSESWKIRDVFIALGNEIDSLSIFEKLYRFSISTLEKSLWVVSSILIFKFNFEIRKDYFNFPLELLFWRNSNGLTLCVSKKMWSIWFEFLQRQWCVLHRFEFTQSYFV